MAHDAKLNLSPPYTLACEDYIKACCSERRKRPQSRNMLEMKSII